MTTPFKTVLSALSLLLAAVALITYLSSGANVAIGPITAAFIIKTLEAQIT